MIKINNLFFRYNSTDIIKGISCVIGSEKITGICGQNGSGKTTFLKIICGILKKYSGDVFIYGKNIKDVSKKELARFISYLPGEISTPFDFKVKDLILMGRTPYSGFFSSYSINDYKRVREVSLRLGVLELLERNFFTLSNGERQLIMLAQSIVQDTYFIIMDEPTSHLDIKHKIKIFEILKEEVHNKNLKVIVVLHDLKLAIDYCDVIFFMKDGIFKYIKTPEDILSDYSFLSDVYSIEKDVIKNYLL